MLPGDIAPSSGTAQSGQPENTAAMAGNSVCAIVVSHFPDIEFEARIRDLLPQAAQVVIVDNTPNDSGVPILSKWLHDNTQVHLIENRANRGISFALNQGLEYAVKGGYQWILTLDQDTQCYPDMVASLIEVSQACKSKLAVIGSNYLDLRNQQSKVPVGDAEGFLEQKTVITSGSLIDVGIATAVGGFREDYFVDQVDHEFCLRMRSLGYQVVISRKPVMNHSVGRPGGVSLPWLGVLPNHPPLRKYYIARNAVVTLANYWRHEPVWCLLRLTRLLLGLGLMAVLEEQRLSKVRAFSGGIADGLRRRMGPCARESIVRSPASQKVGT